MSDWLKGLLDAEEDFIVHGVCECRKNARHKTELTSNFEYTDGYHSYLFNKHERDMGR